MMHSVVKNKTGQSEDVWDCNILMTDPLNMYKWLAYGKYGNPETEPEQQLGLTRKHWNQFWGKIFHDV